MVFALSSTKRAGEADKDKNKYGIQELCTIEIADIKLRTRFFRSRPRFALALPIVRPAVAHRRFLFYDSQIPAADKYSTASIKRESSEEKPKNSLPIKIRIMSFECHGFSKRADEKNAARRRRTNNFHILKC